MENKRVEEKGAALRDQSKAIGELQKQLEEKRLNLEAHTLALEGLRSDHRTRLEEAAGALGGLASLEEEYDSKTKELQLRKKALKQLTNDLTEFEVAPSYAPTAGLTQAEVEAHVQIAANPSPNPNPNPNWRRTSKSQSNWPTRSRETRMRLPHRCEPRCRLMR